MLPEPYRLHHHADFSRAVRRGHRIGRRDLVVHCHTSELDYRSWLTGPGTPLPEPMLVARGPRFGLIVSKAVGNAVIRHRVARRLRHVCAVFAVAVPDGTDIVIRALPSAAAASAEDLAQQIRAALDKLQVVTR